MKQGLSFLIFLLCVQTTLGQIDYQKGYFIDNEGIKTECYIYNRDWNNNPESFKFRFAEKGIVYTGDILSFKEVGIYDEAKYIRASVKIDRSGDIVNKLRLGYSPVWTDETIFLKVIVEGKASLYHYSDKLVKKFFYSIGDTSINQLVYKRYLLPDNTAMADPDYQYIYMGRNKPNIGTNRDYLKQLWLDIRCPENMPVKNVEYDISDLSKYFRDYNVCIGEDYKEYKSNSEKLFFHLSVVAGLRISSLSILNTAYINTLYSNRNTTFSTKPVFSASLAAELVLPFNKNKWALLCEPTFQYYNDEKTLTRPLSETETAIIRFKSIEFPMGVKYYCYLENGFRLSFAALVIPSQSLNFNSYLAFGDNDPLDINPAANFSFGSGIDFKKFSLELRYNTNRHLMLDYAFWHTNYQSLSLRLGYRIF